MFQRNFIHCHIWSDMLFIRFVSECSRMSLARRGEGGWSRGSVLLVLPSHFPRLIPYLGGYLWVLPLLLFLQWPKFAPNIWSKRFRILFTQRSYFQTRMKDRLLQGSRILKVDRPFYIIGFPFNNFQNEELRFSTVFSLIMLFFVFHKKSSDWTISIFFRKTFLFKLFIRKRRNADFMVRIISMA